MWAVAGWSMVAIGLVLYVAFACLWVAVCAAKGVRYARRRRSVGNVCGCPLSCPVCGDGESDAFFDCSSQRCPEDR